MIAIALGDVPDALSDEPDGPASRTSQRPDMLMTNSPEIQRTAAPGERAGPHSTRHAPRVDPAVESLQAAVHCMGSPQLAQMILNSVGDAVLALDAQGRIVGCNPAASALLKCPEGALLQRDAAELLLGLSEPSEQTSEIENPIGATLRDARPRRRHGASLLDADGNWLPVDFVCAPMLGNDGSVAGGVLSFSDASARIAAEQVRSTELRTLELVASGAPLDRILDEIARGLELMFPDSTAAIMLLDPDGVHLRTANAPNLPAPFTQMVDGLVIGPEAGSCGSAIYLRQPVVVADIAIDPRWVNYREMALQFDLRACWSLPVIGHDGTGLGSTALYFKEVREPSSSEYAAIAYFVPLIAIAVERHRKEQALLISEERLRCVVDASVDAVRDWDLRSNVMWWNRREDCDIGFPEDGAETPRAAWSERIHPDERDAVLSSVQAALEGREDFWQARYRFQRRDGEYSHVSDRAVILRDGEGAPMHMIGGVSDVTEQIRMEEQLNQSQRMDSIGQLTGGIAHDFNNLLTVILGNAELLQEMTRNNHSLRDLAGIISTAAQRGAELTQRLLAFARRQALEPTSVDTQAMVEDLLSVLKRLLGAEIAMEFSCATGTSPALADRPQLENALLNLCINARDAMPDGGQLSVRIRDAVLDEHHCERHPDVKPGRYVMLTVSDTGSGILPAHLPRVFEPFFTTKPMGKGTGLGLAMVYGFVKQSHGHVEIHSEPGAGTSVSLFLPFAEHPIESAGPNVNRPDTTPGRGKILLVEDDALVLKYAAGQLQLMGYEVTTASNGPEAIVLVERGLQFDLLFTDVIMPGGMTGVELAGKVRSLRPGTPVLFTSGYTENAMLQQGRIPAGTHLLSKPYRRADLALRLEQALAGGPRFPIGLASN